MGLRERTLLGRTAAIVLAGGRSQRMGEPKALLDWHGRPLVEHVVAQVAAGVDGPVVVVHAPNQAFATCGVGLAGIDVEQMIDEVEGRGPLQGLASGLAALGGRADVAFVCAVDLPFIDAGFIRTLLGALGEEHDAVLPVHDGIPHPLAAVYRVALAPIVARLLDEGERRAGALARVVRTFELPLSDAAALRGFNTPAELARARGH